MATYKRNKSGGSQSEGASNSASPASSITLSNPSSTQGINNNAPKYGTLVPNRIFVGGISSNTTEAELSQLFSKYGNVKATKIIADRAGVSKGYGFVTFESEEEVKFLIQDANNIVLKERRLNIAPAIKKQPFNRTFDASSPPPTTSNLYFHNGVPYTFHNGMAFFTPNPHQPTLAALPQSAEPSMYPSFGPSQNATSAHYGTPVLVPAPPPVFMPQNYPYQPLPMTNGAPTQFIYTGSGGSNSGSGSPLAGTPETPHMPSPMPPPYFAQHFPPQEAFFSHPIYISYSYNNADYDTQEQQTPNDDCSSTASTPHSDISDRSSTRSPASAQSTPRPQYMMIKNKVNHGGSCPDMTNIVNTKKPNTKNEPTQSNADSQVPVVSWQNLKMHGEERELLIRNGRRAFHPIVPPRSMQPVMVYPAAQFPNNYAVSNSTYQQPRQTQMTDNSRGQRQMVRGRSRSSVSTHSTIPFIPKFPASFNNNNTLATNNNYHDKKPVDVSNGRSQRYSNNTRVNGRAGGGRPGSTPPSSPKSNNSNPNPNSFVTSPSLQMMQPPPPQYDRPVMVANSAPPRWSNPPVSSHQIKRLVINKRQNGPSSNMSMNNNNNNTGTVRLTKKTQTAQDGMESDLGGGGDAPSQPALQLALTPPSTPSTGAIAGNDAAVTANMQALTLGASS